ncbi:transcriptional regulator [Streptomyces sp. H27-G5]|uniref:transcriptional regulator n=1 Tax=Streptomyces sp. H27-G5 TaxID=2996698 RepID=UPI00226D7F1A|nr:transcriptional regulator [Streptomyces sp. H27-G5]MCY0923153.1 transcriptional regulator [Streptomyces sp. H27-G5]
MYDIATRMRVLALVTGGRSVNSVSKETGISRSAIRARQSRPEPRPRLLHHATPCQGPADQAAYAYLLGLYLGDGCISPHPRGGQYLRIACADAWPGLIEHCRVAITAVRPGDTVSVQQKQGCVAVTAYGHHWTCLFPQHGPGRKHERPIVLEDWQREIVDARPWEFLRGLIHSAGCRITNWTTRIVGGVSKRYEYPRYFFTNTSDDIRRLCTDTMTRVGVWWTVLARGGDPFNVSVARRESVALMDAHIGPKH